MTSALLTGQVALIAEAFCRRAAEIEPLGNDRWRLTLENGKPFAVDVWLDAGWLVAAVDVQEVPPGRYWEIVRLNGRAEPLVRFALSPPHGTTRLRAELPLSRDWDDEDAASARHVPALCSGFEAAMGLLDGAEPPDVAEGAAEPAEADVAADLVALCREAGWQAEARSGGRLAVELKAEGVAEALVAPRAESGVRVSVDLGRCESLSTMGRMATAGLLLTATGHVRMARAAVGKVEGVDRARLEVVFGAQPKPDELDHALRALEIASDLAALELKVLQDERLAQRYVLGQRWCA
jgi:hypothetical protein